MKTIEQIYEIFKEHSTVCTDTRNVTRGSIFFALKGENFNANQFAKAAIDAGSAYAIIDEKEFELGEKTILVNDVLQTLQELAKHHRAQLKIPVIAITGTNGKTTSKELTHAALSTQFNTLATKGNLNNHIGVPLTLLSVNSSHEIAIIEMGANHVGEIEFLCSIANPAYGLITNIGKAHLEGFGGVQGVIKAKSELYRHLRNVKGTVFLNIDNDLLKDLAVGINSVSYGKSNAQVTGVPKQSSGLLNMTIKSGSESFDLNTNLVGDYNAENVLAAITIASHFNIPFEKIKTGIESYFPNNNRSQFIERNGKKIISDAYNANPSSMSVAIENLARMDAKDKLAILGDMLELGADSIEEHKKVIRLLEEKNIDAMLVGPQFKKAAGDKFNCFDNVADAVRVLSQRSLDGCLVLVKGSRGIQLEKAIEVL